MAGDDLVEVQLTSDRMLEYILTPDNLNRAYRQVKANKGSGGIDKMEVEHLLPYLRSHKMEIARIAIPFSKPKLLGSLFLKSFLLLKKSKISALYCFKLSN